MGQEALVNGEETFSPDGFEEAIKDALIEVTVLVVHSGHYRIWKGFEVSRVRGN